MQSLSCLTPTVPNTDFGSAEYKDAKSNKKALFEVIDITYLGEIETDANGNPIEEKVTTILNNKYPTLDIKGFTISPCTVNTLINFIGTKTINIYHDDYTGSVTLTYTAKPLKEGSKDVKDVEGTNGCNNGTTPKPKDLREIVNDADLLSIKTASAYNRPSLEEVKKALKESYSELNTEKIKIHINPFSKSIEISPLNYNDYTGRVILSYTCIGPQNLRDIFKDITNLGTIKTTNHY